MAIKKKAKMMKKHNQTLSEALVKSIALIKQETNKHQKRLEKRKAEELERGAHEYANYLVSMLNSGEIEKNSG